ncbi:HopJ type III effector protein [Ostreococcus tauri]|uniref:HopJ type III effector protein n=1 Tax=Ostreococcus tauri TaxID=70448 RepID=A0A096P913_OSTTA|nr:HopJ type III effector protein [Ostreococcus tauri]CEG00490.1 HopJ type III effector protein [Ostreococcus tauri]|eukprot:XP_003083780.2 HopJ type III effector protein [Ostreococcus tauri]
MRAMETSTSVARARVAVASETRARRGKTIDSRARSTRARAGSDDASTMREMRAAYERTRANPGADAVIEAVRELAEQEFGLSGVAFNEVMGKIDECFDFVPTAYASGVGTSRETRNAAGTNNGSCKTFYFAKMCGLSEKAAVRLFCEHYEDVANAPDGDSHANIRAFMENGYAGLTFEGEALVAKGSGSNDI